MEVSSRIGHSHVEEPLFCDALYEVETEPRPIFLFFVSGPPLLLYFTFSPTLGPPVSTLVDVVFTIWLFVSCFSLDPIQSNPIQSKSRRLLETRGGLIIRKLCVLLQPKTIYVALASVLQTNSDLAFIGVMVEVWNLSCSRY